MHRSEIANQPPPRRRATTVVYGLLLIAAAAGLAGVARPRAGAHQLVFVGALVALAIGDYVVSHQLRRVWVYDMGVALALIGVVLAGPLAGFAVAVAPDVIHLARRRRAFWNAGLAANVASWAAAALAGAAVLSLTRSVGEAPAILTAALAMVTVNYLLARLLLASLRDRQPIGALVRNEFVATLPLQVAALAVATIAALLVPVIGAPVLLGFATLVYLPQLGLERLARAPSVAALPIAAAATVYRAAIADELCLSRRDRRAVEQTAALLARQPERVGAPANLLAIIQDALIASICLETLPTQPAFTASPRAQIVILAQQWAELTAKCTPALSHREALNELTLRATARDVPSALSAAHAIIERERTLTQHTAGVPRLHRLPAPRSIRHRYLPTIVAQLTT